MTVATFKFALADTAPILEWAVQNTPGFYPYTSDPAPAGLLFIKDQGIYLMANTNPRQLRADQKWSVVCYADGYGPDCDWWEVHAAAGGDDFAEFLPLDEVLRVVNAAPADRWFVIEFDPNDDAFSLTTAP